MTILEPFLAHPEKIEKDNILGIKWAKTPIKSHFIQKIMFNGPY